MKQRQKETLVKMRWKRDFPGREDERQVPRAGMWSNRKKAVDRCAGGGAERLKISASEVRSAGGGRW